jgi:hypothetical protein
MCGKDRQIQKKENVDLEMVVNNPKLMVASCLLPTISKWGM